MYVPAALRDTITRTVEVVPSPSKLHTSQLHASSPLKARMRVRWTGHAFETVTVDRAGPATARPGQAGLNQDRAFQLERAGTIKNDDLRSKLAGAGTGTEVDRPAGDATVPPASAPF